jgi:hypothetical protein
VVDLGSVVEVIVVEVWSCGGCTAKSFSADWLFDGEVGDEGEAALSFEASASASTFAGVGVDCTIPMSSFKLAARLGGAVIPPAVGKPSSARVDLHCLYLVRGNRSLTSSIVINFFSLLRRCALGIAPISIGSPSSPFRKALFRWLYRKQYLTPTMILEEHVRMC